MATGVFLALYFVPSTTQVIYHGTYVPLRGRPCEDCLGRDGRIHGRQQIRNRCRRCRARRPVPNRRGLNKVLRGLFRDRPADCIWKEA